MTALLGTYDHYGYAAIALLGTFVGAWFLLWVTLSSPWAERIRAWRGVSPPFRGVVGVLFALTLGGGVVLTLLVGRRLYHRFRGQPDRADLDRPAGRARERDHQIPGHRNRDLP